MKRLDSAIPVLRRTVFALAASIGIAVLIGGGAVAAGPQHGHGEHDATASHRFDDVDRWVARFDDPERDAWQRPDEVVEFLDLAEDATVVDLGAGTGYFAVRLAAAVPRGKVLAVDIEPALIEHVRERVAEAGLANVEARVGRPDDPELGESSADRILIVNTWHHIDDRLRYLEHLSRALKPGGSVVVVDYRDGDLPVGPPAGHKLSAAHVRGEFEKAGWTPARSTDALPYQYVLEFRP